MAGNKEKAKIVLQELALLFPDAECELVHTSAFELTVAVILSAQATDVSVNKVTPALFARYPDAASMATATQKEIEPYIASIGLYHNKAKSLHLLSLALMERYQGEMPNDFDALVGLPGVGRKSANVILSVWFGTPAFAVDTHVDRVSKRLQFCKDSDTVLEVEKKMCRYIPREQWNDAHHLFIFFGRYLCKSQRPECERCPLQEYCKYYKKLLKAKNKDKSNEIKTNNR